MHDNIIKKLRLRKRELKSTLSSAPLFAVSLTFVTVKPTVSGLNDPVREPVISSSVIETGNLIAVAVPKLFPHIIFPDS